jgi:hypothetical protein
MIRAKSLIGSFVLFTFITAHTSIAFAEEVDVDEDGTGDYVELKETETAPFDGFLLHKDAMVKLIVDKKHEVESLKLQFDTDIKKLKLDWDTDLKKKDLELSINKDMYESILKVRQDRIDQLSSEQKWSDVKLIGGFVLGFAVSIAMFYAAVQVAK